MQTVSLFIPFPLREKKTILLVNFTRDFTVVTLHCGGVIVQSKRRVRQQRQSQTNRKKEKKKIYKNMHICVDIQDF